MDLGYSLKLEQWGFALTLDLGCDMKTGFEDIFNVLALVTRIMTLPFLNREDRGNIVFDG